MTEVHADQRDKDWEVIVARAVAQVEAMRPVWQMIYEREQRPTPYAHIDWHLAVMEGFTDSAVPHVIQVSFRGRAVAMAVGSVATKPIDVTIGYKTFWTPSLRCLSFVHGGVLGHPTKAALEVLLTEIRATLHRGEADVAFFEYLQSESHLFQLAARKCRPLQRDLSSVIDRHWIMSLPNDIANFYQSKSGNSRHELRRTHRVLERDVPGGVEVLAARTEQQIEELLPEIARVSQLTYQHALGAGIVNDAPTRCVLRAAAARGVLRAYLLRVRGEPWAFLIGYVCRGTFFWKLTGYDPGRRRYSPGTVLLLRVLEETCADPSVHTFDFGFGDAPYKRRYADSHSLEGSLYLFANRRFPLWVNGVRSCFAGITWLLRRFVRYTNLNHWVKRRWRDLLQVTR